MLLKKLSYFNTPTSNSLLGACKLLIHIYIHSYLEVELNTYCSNPAKTLQNNSPIWKQCSPEHNKKKKKLSLPFSRSVNFSHLLVVWVSKGFNSRMLLLWSSEARRQRSWFRLSVGSQIQKLRCISAVLDFERIAYHVKEVAVEYYWKELDISPGKYIHLMSI